MTSCGQPSETQQNVGLLYLLFYLPFVSNFSGFPGCVDLWKIFDFDPKKG